MSPMRRTYERRAYTILDLLGDVGGFNDSILIIVGFFATQYNSMLYTAALYDEARVAP